MNDCIITETPPQWVIDELASWFKEQKAGSFAVHTTPGREPAIELTIHKKAPAVDKQKG